MVVSGRPQTNFKEVFIPESNQTPSQPYIPSAKSYWHMKASQGDSQKMGDKKRFTIRQTDLMRRLIEENQHLLALQRLNCSVDPIKTRTRAVLHKTLLPVLERKTIAQVNRLSLIETERFMNRRPSKGKMKITFWIGHFYRIGVKRVIGTI
jgi:hypothetical protein